MHGLIDIDYINRLKLSSSFNEASFAREYLSIWSGSSEESWFNFDKLQKHRKIKNPELHAFGEDKANQFYLLSVDVGRLHDQTVCCVWRINIRNDRYYSTLVNLYVLGRQKETKTFYQQCIELKKIIRAFNPEEVVIDTNGLGIGFGEEMTRPQIDKDGIEYPAYGFKNDEDFKRTQPKDAPCILYGIKANGPLNSKIHSNAYARVTSGLVKFLITEMEAKNALMATKVGQKMSVEKRIQRLMPHEMTTRLFEEIANLRLKRSGANLDIVLEQINPRFPKDKYSAFAYGLWRIKEKEEEQAKRKARFGNGSVRNLFFYTGG